MKKASCLVALPCAVLLLASPAHAQGSKDRLIGKWENPDAETQIALEFTRDGKVTLSVVGHRFVGTYNVNGEDELALTFDGKTATGTFKVTRTHLDLTIAG